MGLREDIVNYIQRIDQGGEGAVPVTAWHMQHVKSGLVGNT